MSNLTGKVAIVTGGGRGIGRATALALAQAGCDVAVFARSREELERVVGDIRASGRQGIAVTGDLLEATNITHAYTEVVRQLGHIDILINNAAVVEPLGPITAIDPNRWATAIELNLVGPFRWIRACVPAMLERGWGRIVNISAGAAAETGMQYGNAYATSKAGLEMLTRNLAAEVTGTGVTVNAVRPGAVDTTMNAHVRHQPSERVGQQIHERFERTYEQSLLLNPDQPARLIVNLIQEGATGEVVSIYDQRGQQLIGQ